MYILVGLGMSMHVCGRQVALAHDRIRIHPAVRCMQILLRGGLVPPSLGHVDRKLASAAVMEAGVGAGGDCAMMKG